MNRHLNIIIEKDTDGYYAYVPELKGCQSQGDTLDEVTYNINEAIELYLETMTQEQINDVLNKETIIRTKELEIA
ncbi:MAG: hypothetical protein Kapaf2KO_23120 [Candidatus Kapaibacteriales bacterium]